MGCEVFVNASSREVNVITYEESKDFLDYLINHSPFAKACLTDDPEEAFMRGIVVDCSYSSRLIGWGIIMHRAVREHPSRVRAFHYAVSKGFDYMTALLAFCCLSMTGQGKVNIRGGIIHGPIPDGIDVAAVQGIHTGSLEFDDKPFSEIGGFYSYFQNIMSRRDTKSPPLEELATSVLEYERQDGVFVKNIEVVVEESVLRLLKVLEEACEEQQAA